MYCLAGRGYLFQSKELYMQRGKSLRLKKSKGLDLIEGNFNQAKFSGLIKG